jgi:sodium transport system permease protein
MSTPDRGASLVAAWQVFRKELVDALRDRRTLVMVLLSSVAIGPLLLVALSMLVADLEARAEARALYAVGLENAPTLRNYIERQAWRIHLAPADHEAALVKRSFGHAVLVVPA